MPINQKGIDTIINEYSLFKIDNPVHNIKNRKTNDKNPIINIFSKNLLFTFTPFNKSIFFTTSPDIQIINGKIIKLRKFPLFIKENIKKAIINSSIPNLYINPIFLFIII